MSKIIIVSNRLPVSIQFENETPNIEESIGGLATGVKTFHQKKDSIWLGWAGIPAEDIDPDKYRSLAKILQKDFKCSPILLTKDELEGHYYGFSNCVIWPLFHYFPQHVSYSENLYQSYKAVNRKFLDALKDLIEPDDTVWIHDYQLLLLPAMLRDLFPQVKIGFFLHIPFPSFELFRSLPWRSEILHGMLGADLLGFHTYDYVRHFQSSVRRLLRLDYSNNFFYMGNRPLQIDVFPMGIDYDRYHTALSQKDIRHETSDIFQKTAGMQIVLSVDRLDYTKGIPERIKAYAQFLTNNPRYRERVTMILIVAPSRVLVDSYQSLLQQINALVGETNGKFGSIGWVPILFFYRTFHFEALSALYGRADAMVVTPLRDGMNLIAKEYIATRVDKQGMLVISEMAGAASELSEALLVNPTNINQVAQAIKDALEMPKVEQITRNKSMQERLLGYDVNFWAEDFMSRLDVVCKKRQEYIAYKISADDRKNILSEFRGTKTKAILLDYDGTLSDFFDNRYDAIPSRNVKGILRRLSEIGANVALISGRDRNTMSEWFGDLPISLVATHGLWYREVGKDWAIQRHITNEWKTQVRPILELQTNRTPGSLIEEKEYSLVWHYRRCDPDLAQIRLGELRDTLRDVAHNVNIGMVEGNKVFELKDNAFNKGHGVFTYLQNHPSEFILCAGDDWTDEDMFAALPSTAYTIKVGTSVSKARFRVGAPSDMIDLLTALVD